MDTLTIFWRRPRKKFVKNERGRDNKFRARINSIQINILKSSFEEELKNKKERRGGVEGGQKWKVKMNTLQTFPLSNHDTAKFHNKITQKFPCKNFFFFLKNET